MSVYKKLNEARTAFHSQSLKKTGHNKFAGYDYFELGDFLIPALEVFRDAGLCAFISFDKEVATMRIVDVDGGGEIVLTSPMAEANLKGCHPIQNLGAVETYTRRYLWVTALEIVEHDALDATTGKDRPKHSATDGAVLTAEQEAHCKAIAQNIIDGFADGAEADTIAYYYAADTFADNEERVYVWNLLKPHSNIRSTIKANKPQ